MDKEEFMATRRQVFFVHVKGWSPHAVDFWRGPYQGLPQATAQATKSTRHWNGEPNGDWVAKIYLLDSDTLTLKEM